MTIKEGLIPTILGAAATTAGAVWDGNEMKKHRTKVAPMVAAGIVGFGLAHIVLGSIDLAQSNKRSRWF